MKARHLLVEKDSRGRLSLGSILSADRYLASVDDQGRVLLEPAVVMTATEERLLSDGAFRAMITAAAQEPASEIDLSEL
jgi:hypothetical protein